LSLGSTLVVLFSPVPGEFSGKGIELVESVVLFGVQVVIGVRLPLSPAVPLIEPLLFEKEQDVLPVSIDPFVAPVVPLGAEFEKGADDLEGAEGDNVPVLLLLPVLLSPVLLSPVLLPGGKFTSGVVSESALGRAMLG
jgi:hypothetical protein